MPFSRALQRIISRYVRQGLELTPEQLRSELSAVGYEISAREANAHLFMARRGRQGLGTFESGTIRVSAPTNIPYTYIIQFQATLVTTNPAAGGVIPGTYHGTEQLTSQRPLTTIEREQRLRLIADRSLNPYYARQAELGSDTEVLEVADIEISDQMVVIA